jgi:TM2 domain-containing membrane protein YozV
MYIYTLVINNQGVIIITEEKNKALALVLSFFISGSGLLYIDSKKYLIKFLLCFLLWWLFIPWILGLYWTATAPELIQGTNEYSDSSKRTTSSSEALERAKD